MHKKLAISKQLQTHFKGKKCKRCGNTVPTRFRPTALLAGMPELAYTPRIYSRVLSCICVFFVTAMHV